MLEVTGLTYTYAGEQNPALKDVSFRVAPGECVCFSGHSGCGKTTLLLALKGLLHDGSSTGTISYGSVRPTAEAVLSDVGLVFQNSESQILCATVFDEVAFGPENLRLPPPEINDRIIEALSAVDLLAFGNRNVERFSAGQKQRLCIAAVLSMHPRCILLDEPTSQLDRKGRTDLLRVLLQLKTRGISIILAEHNIEPFIEIIDRYYPMSDGTLIGPVDHPPAPSVPVQVRCPERRPPRWKTGETPVISVEDLSVSYPGGETILKGITCTVAEGELIHLYGENGCGKSTLLKTIAGAMRPDSGSLRAGGETFAAAGRIPGTIALLFQNPQRQLFEDTVYDETAFTLRRMKMPEDEVDRRVGAALVACEAEHLKDRLPLTLSFGEQHRVALASVIAPNPGVILLDEPFAGLDPSQRLRLLRILSGLREERGTAVVIASHDPLPDPEWADRIVVMEEGRIISGGTCRQ
jgi:energy-coupling factor transport system ATP-binding protein